ncbi:MAG: sigma-70 family RNA polymerase sigma factor [Planctomycetes bacterium]|nr:sigma-70 family RNA polymerase sigma factor [Planctomycetota bacterium]MCB9892113.1 sigma-70 family RNA polymerase sigma factor [Planctomycetota bacterium]
MTGTDTTSWRVIHGAAGGDALARDEFARRYAGPMGAYFTARWRKTPILDAVDDAVQEAFLECFRTAGALQKAQAGRDGGFRAYFYGVLLNVARRFEQQRVRDGRLTLQEVTVLDNLAATGDTASVVFDREWARMIMREAAQRLQIEAMGKDEAARRRVELLRLRFQEGLPIRDIAVQWNMDAAQLHHDYAKARKEFEGALRAVVAEQSPRGDDDDEVVAHMVKEVVRALGR